MSNCCTKADGSLMSPNNSLLEPNLILPLATRLLAVHIDVISSCVNAENDFLSSRTVSYNISNRGRVEWGRTKDLTQSTNIGRKSCRLGISVDLSVKYWMTEYIMPTNGFNLEAYFSIVFATSAGILSLAAALGILGVAGGGDDGCLIGLDVPTRCALDGLLFDGLFANFASGALCFRFVARVSRTGLGISASLCCVFFVE